MLALSPSDLPEDRGIQIEVYKHNNLIVTTVDPNVLLPRHRNATMMDELNADGGGSFEIRMDDPIFEQYPNILDGSYVARMIHPQSGVVWFIMNRTETVVVDESGNRWYKVAGAGLLSWWDHAMVFPGTSGRVMLTGMPKREFNFGSVENITYGQWVYPSDWTKTNPFGATMSAATPAQWQTNQPSDGWPSNMSGVPWVWNRDTNTTVAVADEEIYVRGHYTFASQTRIKIFCSVRGHSAQIFVDGEKVMDVDGLFNGWERTSTVEMQVKSGTRVFGIRAKAFSAGGAAGVRFVVAKVTTTTNVTTGVTTETLTQLFYPHNAWPGNATAWWLRNPTPGNPRLPNWSAIDMMYQLHEEAKARGVDYAKYMFIDTTQLMTDVNRAHDADNGDYLQHYPWSFDVGTTYREVINRLISVGYDIWMDPITRQLKIAQTGRGGPGTSAHNEPPVSEANYPDPIARLMPGYNIVKAKSTQGESKIINTVLFNSSTSNYTYPVDSAGTPSTTTYGKREAYLSGDYTRKTEMVDNIFAQSSLPAKYPTVEIIGREGATPFVDFNVGDWIMAPQDEKPHWVGDGTDKLVWRRVMSITAKTADNGKRIEYSIELDSIQTEESERVAERLRQLELQSGGN